MHARKVLLRELRPAGEERGVRAGITKVEEVVLGVVVAHVGEQHRLAREVLENLHGQRAVHVGFGGADHRVLRPLEVVRVVCERVNDVLGGEVVGQLGLRFDSEKVNGLFLVDLLGRVIAANLPLQQLRGEFLSVVVDVWAGQSRQPVEGVLDSIVCDQLRAANDFELVNVLDVDAKIALPLVSVRDRRVHAHGAAAVKAECLAFQPAHGHRSPQ